MFMSRLNTLLLQFTGALLLALLAFTSGHFAGQKSANASWQIKQAKADTKARELYDKKAAQGQAAATAYLEADRALTTQFNDLTEKFHVLRRRTPLVVSTAGLPSCAQRSRFAPAASVPSSTLGTAPLADAAQPDAAQDAAAQADADAGLALSAGAVWLWNSALTGVDQPAHSCGSLDPTAPACALSSGIPLDAAFDNHIANAAICAANRLAHQHLIDFIHQQQRKPATP
jgi:hypothetical protein